MKLQADPSDLVRAIIIGDYSPVEDSIEIVREKHAGRDAAFAVTFDDSKGVQRHGVIGLRKPAGGEVGAETLANERFTAAGLPTRPQCPPEPPTT
jgi:hypothetical protein